MRSIAVTSVLLLCALPAAAGTWIVDDDGGPGVDFTQIQAAIDAAQAGDSIQIFPGNYAGFALTKPLVLFGGGTGERIVGEQVTVSGIAAGSIAAIADLRLSSPFTGWGTDPLLRIESCNGTVVLDALHVGYNGVSIALSDDVRISNTVVEALSWQFYGLRALGMSRARVELVGCSLRGGDGADCQQCELGGQGGDAIWIGSQGELHAYRSSLRGGDGGDAIVPFLGGTGYGGDAGHGIAAEGGPALVAGQAEHVVRGGLGGTVTGGSGLGSAGSPGCGVASNPTFGARASGVTLLQTAAWCSVALQVPVPSDPTLQALGTFVPGGTITYRVTAEPGALVDLNLGRFPALVPVGGLEEDILIQTVRTFPLGMVDGSGVIGMNFVAPQAMNPGSVFFAQARVTLPGGETRYTNSVPVVLR